MVDRADPKEQLELGSAPTRIAPPEVAPPESVDRQRLKASLIGKLFNKPTAAVTIGRYRVLDEIGAGGMGQVFSAYDDDLDRKVAIKVVRSDLASGAAKARLRREAQALGRLAHPNVVTVHEVGEEGGQVFVAMEFVRGVTLRQWRAQARTTREILSVYLQAARGLAAAHAAGILHRDFKPDNAILGEDGRVRVVDFGLARDVSDESESNATTLRDESGRAQSDAPLTKTGAVMGTPIYMAPEQHRGEPTHAKTDQFSFCVALWEALYETRPFQGDSYEEISTNVTEGNRVPPTSDLVLAPKIRAALDRGLAINPAERHPDMNALVVILDAATSPLRSRWWIPATAVPIAGAVAVAVAATRDDTPPAGLEDCAPAAERFAGVWDDDIRARLAAKYTETHDQPYVASSWKSLEQVLDSMAERWSESYANACSAAASPNASERRLAGQRLECLDSALLRIAQLPLSADSVPATDFARAYTGLYSPLALFTCDSDEVVRRLPPAPTETGLAQRVLSVRADVVRAGLALQAGQFQDAQERCTQAVQRARELGHPPLLAEALMALGSTKVAQRDPDAAGVLDEALAVAETGGHDVVIAGVLLQRAIAGDRALEAVGRAERVVARLGAAPEMRAQLQHARIYAVLGAGQPDEARRLAFEAAATLGEDPEVPPVMRAQLYITASEIPGTPPSPEAPAAAARRAIEILEGELGAGHPHVTPLLGRLAFDAFERQRYEESIAANAELEAVLTQIYPEGHPQVAGVLFDHGRALWAQGRLTEARTLILRADAMLSELLGPNHSEEVGGAPVMLASFAMFQGDVPALRAQVQRWRESGHTDAYVEMLSAVVDAMDGKPEVARAAVVHALEAMPRGVASSVQPMRLAAAYVECLLGDQAAARMHAQAALAVAPARGNTAGEALAFVGWLWVANGEHVAALPLLEQAARFAADLSAPDIAWYSPMAHYALAAALVKTGGDRDRARRLAQQAVGASEQTGPAGLGIADAAKALLREITP